MCDCKSEDEIDVCAFAADDIKRTVSGVDGVILETLPETGDIRVVNTIVGQREAFKAAVNDAVAPHYEAKGKPLPYARKCC